MAASFFRPWPWPLAPLARAAFASPALHSTTRRRRPAATMQQLRQASSRPSSQMRDAKRHSQKRIESQRCSSSLLAEKSAEQSALGLPSESSILAPRTFVPLTPLKAFTTLGHRELLQYYKEIVQQRLSDRAVLLRQTFALKDRFFSFAPLKAPRAGVVAAALALHADMSRSLAGGRPADLRRLTEICVPKLHRALIETVEARPLGLRYRWERLALTGRGWWNPWAWPRLIDHKWSDVEAGALSSFRQAVVGIKSKQRLKTLDAAGRVVATKEMELLQYVVLWKHMDKETRTQGKWLIYGTLKETTLHDMMREKAMTKKLYDSYATAALDETRKRLDAR